MTFIDCYRKFLVSEYVGCTDAEGFDKPLSKMRHQLAVESLQCIPTHAFDRKERSTLSNQLLREVMHTTSDITSTARNITLLVKLISIPSKSMNVLTKLNGLAGEEAPGKEDENTAMLVTLAHNLDKCHPEVHIGALRGLKQLARQIMKYVVHCEIR